MALSRGRNIAVAKKLPKVSVRDCLQQKMWRIKVEAKKEIEKGKLA